MDGNRRGVPPLPQRPPLEEYYTPQGRGSANSAGSAGLGRPAPPLPSKPPEQLYQLGYARSSSPLGPRSPGAARAPMAGAAMTSRISMSPSSSSISSPPSMSSPLARPVTTGRRPSRRSVPSDSDQPVASPYSAPQTPSSAGSIWDPTHPALPPAGSYLPPASPAGVSPRLPYPTSREASPERQVRKPSYPGQLGDADHELDMPMAPPHASPPKRSLSIANGLSVPSDLRLAAQVSPGGLDQPASLPIARLPSLDSWKSGLSVEVPAPLQPPIPRGPPISEMAGLEIADGKLMMPLDLPQLPPMGRVRPRFEAECLTVADLERCEEPWVLSQVAAWLDTLMSNTDADFSISSSTQAVSKLLLFRFPDLNWVQGDALAAKIITSLKDQDFLQNGANGELVLDHAVKPSGELTELAEYLKVSDSAVATSPEPDLLTKTASVRSANSVRRRGGLQRTGSISEGLEMDWALYWKIEDTDIDKSVLRRQYAIHELIMTEEAYVRDLDVYIQVYGKLQDHMSVMTDQAVFCKQVFGRLRPVLKANSDLRDKLRARQRHQGPYVAGIGDLVAAWCKDAREPYLAYAGDHLASDHHLRRELADSPALAAWMAKTARDPRLHGVPHSFYFSRVLPRLARYKLLLEAIKKYTPEESVEYGILTQAAQYTTELTTACNDQIDKAQRILDVDNLRAHIVFKGADVTADLRLGDKRRKLIKRGDLLRRGGLKFDWVSSHVLLLDNFFVLSKTRDGQNGRAFYITKLPIPLDLLVIESASDDGEVRVGSKLTLTRGATVPAAAAKSSTSVDSTASTTSKQDSNPKPVSTEVTVLDHTRDALYPLRISHLGRSGSAYTLYAASSIERELWKDAIIEAKRSHSAKAFTRNAEPFRLKLISDAFAYPDGEQLKLPVATPSTALDRCLGNKKLPFPVARSRANCAVAVGGDAYLVGLDYGLWLGQQGQGTADFEWTRVMNVGKITQLEVVEEFNLLLVLSERNLLWYELDKITNLKSKSAVGRRLNRQRKVLDFQVAYLKDRLVVVYLQQDMSSSSIKVIEPIRSRAVAPLQKLSNGHLAPIVGYSPYGPATPLNAPADSSVEYFREIDRAVVHGDVTSITAFHHSVVAHHSSHGFEFLSFDCKVPKAFPAGVSTSVYGKPLAIFRVAANMLVACYELCCLFVDASGKRTKAPVTQFVGTAGAVAYHAPHLVVVGPELVEVRKVDPAGDARAPLLQVVTGKDIHLLGSTEGQVRLAMSHPRAAGRQIVVELLGNEFVLVDDGSSLSGL